MADGRPPVYYSDGIDPVQRSSPGQLSLIAIEARPGPGTPDKAFIDGEVCVVNTWPVDDPDAD